MSLKFRKRAESTSNDADNATRKVFASQRRNVRQSSRVTKSEQDNYQLQKKSTEKRYGGKPHNALNALKNILNLKGSINAFREFLEKEYSHENLDFWLEAEEFRDLDEVSKRERARDIYFNYIDEDSPREINLTHRVRKSIKMELLNPNEFIFTEAQQQVLGLIKNDSLMRYMNTL